MLFTDTKGITDGQFKMRGSISYLRKRGMCMNVYYSYQRISSSRFFWQLKYFFAWHGITQGRKRAGGKDTLIVPCHVIPSPDPFVKPFAYGLQSQKDHNSIM